jgi:hypothetical protein
MHQGIHVSLFMSFHAYVLLLSTPFYRWPRWIYIHSTLFYLKSFGPSTNCVGSSTYEDLLDAAGVDDALRAMMSRASRMCCSNASVRASSAANLTLRF